MTIKHTPGPWSVVVLDTETIVDAPSQTVANEVSNSDADLIAAAPDLLAALIAAERHIRPVPGTKEVRAQVRAALTKAEGG